MGELDTMTDDRLAATLALATRIAGDLAVLVAGLRPDPPKPVPDDGVREGQWRLDRMTRRAYVVGGLQAKKWEVNFRVGEGEETATRWWAYIVADHPFIPAPPDKSAVWAKPKAGQRLWDASCNSWLTARRDFEVDENAAGVAVSTGYPREAGPWRWCEPLAETPAPTPDIKIGKWFVRAHDCTDAVQCLRPNGNRLRNGESEYETTPCLAGRTVRYLLPKCWLPILDRPDAAVLATRGKRLTGVVHVPEGNEQYVSSHGDIYCASTCLPGRSIYDGRRWIVEDIPKPQPKFPGLTWAKHRVDPWPCLVVSKGNGTVRVFYTNGQESKYMPDAESEWTACEDPRVAVTAALAKETT